MIFLAQHNILLMVHCHASSSQDTRQVNVLTNQFLARRKGEKTRELQTVLLKRKKESTEEQNLPFGMGKISKTAKVEKKRRLKETQGVPLPLNNSLKRRRRIEFRRIEAIHQHTQP